MLYHALSINMLLKPRLYVFAYVSKIKNSDDFFCILYYTATAFFKSVPYIEVILLYVVFDQWLKYQIIMLKNYKKI